MNRLPLALLLALAAAPALAQDLGQDIKSSATAVGLSLIHI